MRSKIYDRRTIPYWAMALGAVIGTGFVLYRSAFAEGGVEVDPSMCASLPKPDWPRHISGETCIRPNDSCIPNTLSGFWHDYCCRDAPNGGCLQIQSRLECCEIGHAHGWGFAYKQFQDPSRGACDFNADYGFCY